jgi:hypothetical protein
MKRVMNIVTALTILACLVVLAISIYPGRLDALFFWGIILSVLILPFVAIAALAALYLLVRNNRWRAVRIPRRRLGIILAILGCTFALLIFYVPRRVAFAVSRERFEQLVPLALPSEFAGIPLNKRLGVYRVDEFAADLRGGVYFRVHVGMDGISPDRMSYGFAFKPNPTGTPFGAAHYETFHLQGDWYWFCASNDWF